jgi:prepilin-type N-terminal cleavage/methylation domain-containing protein/prepilin-type processing-associated H-X9-DG protein
VSGRRREGFTLIELLVVIAIIGILAAMLFPVFARARESARKIQCLSNVKNIALAIQMYLTDYDRFPPNEHRPEIIDYFGCTDYPTMANPYLRWPVLLDEYTKNRDIYTCPSARNIWPAENINPCVPDWFTAYQNAGWMCVCHTVYPVGWGGTVTDTRSVNPDCRPASLADGAVELDIQPSETVNYDRSMSSINDPARYLVVAERGVWAQWWCVEQIAFPEACRMRLACRLENADWLGNCDEPTGGDCGVGLPDIEKFWSDPSRWRHFTRHLGGNNIGFADGHAKWMDALGIIAAAGNWKDPHPGLEGVNCQCLPDAVRSPEALL